MKPEQTWSIGIMCYNEIGSIEKTFDNIQNIAPQISTAYEIIIVDDGSTDGSRETIQRLADSNPHVRVIFHEKNMGIGHTLRDIYLSAKMENVANVPADGQFDVTEYLPVMNVPEHSFIAFYRKENIVYTLMRNILSHVNRLFNKYFLGLSCKDVNWTKVYKSADIQLIRPAITSSLVETEICAKLLIAGRKIIEVESKYLERKFGQSKGASMRIVYQAGIDMVTVFTETMRFRLSKKHVVAPPAVTLKQEKNS